jgi:hypothetical protein
MGRLLAVAVLMSATLTLVTAMALRAADATLAVVAVAALVVLLTWYAQLHSTDEHAAAGLVSPASAVALAVVAHVVGGVVGGLAALVLDDRLGETLVFAEPGLALAGIGAAVVGVVGAWTTLAVDGRGPEALSAVPVAVGGAVLPIGLLAVFQPAVVVGLATANLVPWDVALVAATVALVASAVGAYAVSALVPAE